MYRTKKLVSVPGIDLLSGKEHPGSFGRHNTTQHNNQPILFSLFDEEEDLRRRKHDLVDDSDARKIKTMYAAFVPRSYGCSSFSLAQKLFRM